MKRIIKYFFTTAERLILLKPNEVCNAGRYFLLKVIGMIDSNYAKDYPKKSVSG